MILNGGKKAYNVKLCLFLFWNYFPMIKKKKKKKTKQELPPVLSVWLGEEEYTA